MNKYFLILLLCVFSCQKQTTPSVQPAFYHWQTQLDIQKAEQQFMDSLEVKKLYVKFFDVDWDAGQKDAVPLARLDVARLPSANIEIVPVIFITNRTLLNLSADSLSKLSGRIHQKIKQLWEPCGEQQLREIQLDCDWTGRSRSAFFKLIEYLRSDFAQPGLIFSATIRLHQFKYPDRTGIPPVERGMLMFYNMGELEDLQEQNSILNLKTARQYLQHSDYPLHLDIALPLFRWGVLFRDGKMIRLINELSAEELTDTSRFLKKRETVFEVIKSTYLDGHYLYADDLVRLESVNMVQLKEAAELLRPLVAQQEMSLAFYSLDSAIINRFTYQELDTLAQIFKK